MYKADRAYTDSSLPIADRVSDLMSLLTLKDKAALLFHADVGLGSPDSSDQWGRPGAGVLMREHGITHFLVQGAVDDARELAAWHNHLQRIALEHPLGVPVTVSSDPRHSVSENRLTSSAAGGFSQWPEPLGVAAIGSGELAELFGDIVRKEYAAVGIRVALHPQVDLATEPRWARIMQTFGEDAELTTSLALAYVRGLQGETVGVDSVSGMGKHFPGGGPQKDGLDPHFSDGRDQIYPGGRFDYHLAPFIALIDAGISQLMPYYGLPSGTEWEEVGFSYNKGIITDLLRRRLGFDGIVCTDFGVITGMGDYFPARAWGVEHLSAPERVARLLEAGVDQFGGEKDPGILLEAIRTGLVHESDLDVPLRRLLSEKFRLGLFDEKRFVDEDAAIEIVGSPDHVDAGRRAQQASLVLLKNGLTETSGQPLLPLTPASRVYVEGMDVATLEGFAVVVDSPADADVAIVRVSAPDYADPARAFLGSMHRGSLEFPSEVVDHVNALAADVPTVVDVFLDRPAVLSGLEAATSLFASFGTHDHAFVEVLFGDAQPEGKLPVDLPRSMAAVEASRTDVPFDTADPLFPFGHGLRYAATKSPADMSGSHN